MKKICQFISKYMGVLVFAAAVLAFVFPDELSKIRPTVINYLLGVVMFGMGLTLNLQDFKIVFSRPKDIIIGCLASSLATLHFASYPLATIPGAIFSVWHNISGAIVAYLFRK
ncbi:MAG: hypothetical protein J6V95_06185 [Bacteroidaceae bacterium]|nr:hypothetical protein [Bacteroidaceae bacterium]